MPREVKSKQRDQRGSSQVVATSQVTRFQKQITYNLTQDIDLSDVTISVGNNDLLVNADLRLFSGVKYGLIGPNGSGKSTLLKCIGYKKIPGIQSNLRILYVEQLKVSGSKSVLDEVLSLDNERVQLTSHLSLLEKALSTGENKDIKAAVKKIRLQRHEDSLEKLRMEIDELSGSRGYKARKEALGAEETLRQLELLSLNDIHDGTLMASEIIEELHMALSVYDSEEVLKVEASKILSGLGFTEDMKTGLAQNLSGGWRVRASLAAALLIKPNILLLDEPTNHLDLPTVVWLQRHLQLLHGVTLVVVSHNRSFLNEVAEEIIVIKDEKLNYYEGNFDSYAEEYTKKQTFLKTKAEAIEKKKENIVSSVNKGILMAKKSGDDKKMQNMASKMKKIDLLGMDVNDKGHRFKLNRDRGGFHNNLREKIVVDKQLTSDKWKVEQPYPLRYQGDIIMLNEVGFRYSSNSDVIFGRVNLSVGQRSRIGIVGANGVGKSTLMKILAGELNPTVGSVQFPGNPKIGKSTQFNVEEFLKDYNANFTAQALISGKFPGRKESQYRAHLARFGLKGDLVIKPLIALSGGEMARLKLASNFFENSPHALILDEPTNHLDFWSTDSLVELLKSYEGAVIIASHDQYFVSSVAEEVYTFEKKQLKKLKDVESFIDNLNVEE